MSHANQRLKARAARRRRRNRRPYMHPVLGTSNNNRKRVWRNWWRKYLPTEPTRRHHFE